MKEVFQTVALMRWCNGGDNHGAQGATWPKMYTPTRTVPQNPYP